MKCPYCGSDLHDIFHCQKLKDTGTTPEEFFGEMKNRAKPRQAVVNTKNQQLVRLPWEKPHEGQFVPD